METERKPTATTTNM